MNELLHENVLFEWKSNLQTEVYTSSMLLALLLEQAI